MKPMPKTMTLSVTQADIATGKPNNAYDCAITKAATRRTGQVCRTGMNAILVYEGGLFTRYALPPAAIEFRSAFDSRLTVRPIRFRVTREAAR